MIVGILSDNHGRLAPIEWAIDVFAAQGVEAVFHCGDVGGVETLERLAAACPRVWFVWGNTDRPSRDDAKTIARLGLAWPTGPIVVELAGRRIALAHGHEVQFALLHHDDSLDYVLSGHTHQRSDRRSGLTRHINPGALYRVGVRTVATLDLATDALQFHELMR